MQGRGEPDRAAPREAAQDRGISKINNFDFLRFFLASLVIFSHSYPLLQGNDSREPLILLTGGQLTAGTFAVDGFFLLSGFLITASFLQSSSFWSYLRKRVLRIFPGFIAACLACALLFAPLGAAHFSGYVRAVGWPSFFLNLPLLHLHLPQSFLQNPYPGAIDGSLWTIPYEFECYLFIGVLGIFGLLRKTPVLAAFCASLALSTYDFYFIAGEPSKALGVLLVGNRLLTFFLAGSLAMQLFTAGRLRLTGWGAVVSGALILVAALTQSLVLVLPFALTYLGLWFAFCVKSPLQRFGKHGDISYGVYLYAFPIEQLLVHWLSLTPVLLFLLAFPITCVFAVGSWTFVERPFMRMKQRAALVFAPQA